MPVSAFTIVGIYVVCWWTVLFAVLPLGLSRDVQEPPTDGTQWGAPVNPNLKKKFITTTWVSTLLWALVMVIILTGWLPLPDLSRATPL